MDNHTWRTFLLSRLTINIIRKDWFEHRKVILSLTAGMFVPLIISGGRTDFAKGMMIGVLIGASYGYAHFCFMAERQRGTLQLLLSLPVHPLDLVIAKYASLYSMVLFTANVPGVFLRDFRALFLLNSLVLLLSSICMAATVISDKPWAPMIPLWFVLIFFMPIRKLLEQFYPDGLSAYLFVTSHVMLVAALALISAPVIALISALYFERRFTYVD